MRRGMSFVPRKYSVAKKTGGRRFLGPGTELSRNRQYCSCTIQLGSDLQVESLDARRLLDEHPAASVSVYVGQLLESKGEDKWAYTLPSYLHADPYICGNGVGACRWLRIHQSSPTCYAHGGVGEQIRGRLHFAIAAAGSRSSEYSTSTSQTGVEMDKYLSHSFNGPAYSRRSLSRFAIFAEHRGGFAWTGQRKAIVESQK
jgi:hypothetical protein